MNYAAVLAVMVLLAFTFPLAVRLGEYLGLSAGATAVTLWTVLLFAVAVAFVRWRVAVSHGQATQLAQGRQQVQAAPSDPAAYYVGGQHLALLLLERGRRREAAELIDRYAQLGGATDAEILSLREALSAADRWRFQRKNSRPPVRELQAAQKQQAERDRERDREEAELLQAPGTPITGGKL